MVSNPSACDFPADSRTRLPFVGLGRQKLAYQIARGREDLDRVKTGFLGSLGRFDKILLDTFDVVKRHCCGHLPGEIARTTRTVRGLEAL